MYAALLLLLPLIAPKPGVPAEFFVTVHQIVINRVRSQTVERDNWDRPTYKPSETYWVLFWNIPYYSPFPGAWWPSGNYRLLIDRGWMAGHQVRAISRCSGGFIVESKDGMNVVGPMLLFIDSPYDWEIRNRRTYKPVRRP